MLYQRVPIRQVPICPFRHICCRMYRLATKTKRTEKNTNLRKSDREFFDTYHQACTGRVTYFTDFVNTGQSRLSGLLSFGAFINFTHLDRILRTSRSSTCSRNRFDSLPVYGTL